jgi:protein-tyrosine phosphatase
MIDVHSHILYETDDGARDIDESLKMCRLAAGDGIKVMVATPHAHDSVHTTHHPDVLRRKVEELNARLDGQLKVELGCELRFNHDVIRQVCHERTAPTIAGGPYVLVEFPHYVVPVGSERVLFELMSHQFRPIIAHPERNRQLMDDPERFYSLVEMGVLGQLDSGSILGQFGRKVEKTARVLLEHGLIHMIASDCHNTRNRLPGLSMSVAAVSSMMGEDIAARLTGDNPAAVVAGQPTPWRPTPASPTRKKRWILF